MNTRIILIYLTTLILMICFLAFIGYSEVNVQVTNPPEFNDPEMESFDPKPFDLHLLPPDNDHLIFDPLNVPNPLPSASPHLFPLSRLKSGHHSKIYDLIVVHQVGIDEIDSENGYTLLHYLARSYNLFALKFLLNQKTYGENGVNSLSKLESGSKTPLHLAVNHPNLILALFITHLLIEYKADPTIPDINGLTPADLAAQSHRDERILKVIKGEYDPRSEYETESKSFLDFAFGSLGPPKDPCFFN